MNFKTPFKVLTTAALIGTLAVSTVAPGAASAATNTTVSAKAEVAQDIKSVVLKKGDDSITLSYNDYASAQGSKVLEGYVVTHVVADNGAVYDYETYGLAYSKGATTTEVFKKLAGAEASTTEVPAEAKEASFNEDGELVISTPTEEDFKVTEIAAITESGVEVSFPALTADKEDVTIEVKDSKGAVHAVKAVNLSKGDAKATFEFEKAVATADLTGKWTIGKASYDFDAIKQLEDIKSAAQGDDVVKLLKALKAGSITDVAETDAALAKYKEAITDAAPKTLAEVQEAIAKANEELAETDAATKAVKAVADAKGQVALLNALQDGFKRVNADWISSYAAGNIDNNNNNNTLGIIINNTPNTIVTPTTHTQAAALTAENIQATIDAINKNHVLTLWGEAWDNADAKKLAEVNALADFLADDTDEQKVVKEYYADEAKILAAVINVNTVAASTATNGSFEKAVVALDTLENELVAKYKGTQYASEFVEGLDITTLKSDLLSKYRAELKTTAADDRNQASDIQSVINKVNAGSLNTLLTTLNTADVDYTNALISGTDTATKEAAFLKALKAVAAFDTVNFKDVAIEDKRAALYVDAIDLSNATLNAANANDNSEDVADAVSTTNDGAEAAAIAAINNADNSGTEDALLTALESKELVLSNVVKANKTAYKAEDFTSSAVTTKKAAQLLVNQVNALVAINAAKTAADVQPNLSVLGATNYTKVNSDDRAKLAQLVLDAREEGYTGVANATNATNTAAGLIVNAVAVANDKDSDTDAILEAFGAAGVAGFEEDADLDAKVDLANKFLASLTYDTDGVATPKFASLKAVEAQLAK